MVVPQCLKINTYNRGVITMAYIINKTNGTQIAVVEDGTIDQTTDPKLVGKNYAGYGEIQNENFTCIF